MRYSTETSERSVGEQVRTSEKVHHQLVLCSNCYNENFGKLIKHSEANTRRIKSSSRSGGLSSSREGLDRKLDARYKSREASEAMENYRRLEEKLGKLSENRGLFDQRNRELDDMGHAKNSRGSERGIKLLAESRADSESMSQSQSSRGSRYTQNESDYVSP
ncbi:MAG: hypothetical protein MHMPM18_000174 [Marteilia pararefringens]